MCAPRASASTSSGCAYSRSIRSRTRRSHARSRRCCVSATSALRPGGAGAGAVSKALGKEDTLEALLARSVRLDKSSSGIETKVLRHQLVGVKPHLTQTGRSCLLVREVEEPGTDPPALGGRSDRHVA